MPRNHADFDAYMAARWPILVRALVLLGCSGPEAEDLVRSGLARCYTSWDRVRKADDVDVHVYRTVLEDWHRSLRRGRGEHADAVPVLTAPEEDATYEELLREALQAQLAGLTPEDREVLVLRFVADLTEPQLADVLEVPVATAMNRLTDALGRLDLAALEEMTG